MGEWPSARRLGSFTSASDETAAPALQTDIRSVNEAGVSAAGTDGPSLDQLPPELLLEVASWLDLPSILRLECASRRYRDAGPRLRQQLRILRVGEHANGSTASKELLELLPQLLGLRELHVRVPSSLKCARSLLEALAAASRHWRKLGTLQLTDMSNWLRPDINQLLMQLCESCSRLTDVTLFGDISDGRLEGVASALPAVRTFRVNNPSLSSTISGSFLSRLPAELRHLSVGCTELHSGAVTKLLRYSELRTLKLLCWRPSVEPAHLAAGLSGCGRLRRLTVNSSALSSECLLHLTQLRHLDLSSSRLTDAELGQLLSALPPGLESFSLKNCCGLTPEGLANGLRELSSVPSLCTLDLTDTAGVCDRTLAELRSQSLQQLYLSHQTLRRLQNGRVLTAKGLLGVVHNCGCLEALILRLGAREERIACDSGAREQGLFEKIQTTIDLQAQKSRATSRGSRKRKVRKRRRNS